jgi:hypothetical protein
MAIIGKQKARTIGRNPPRGTVCTHVYYTAARLSRGKSREIVRCLQILEPAARERLEWGGPIVERRLQCAGVAGEVSYGESCILKLHRLATLVVCAITVGCDTHAPSSTISTPDKKSQPRISAPTKAATMNEPNYEVAEIYTGLRNQVLHLNPDTVGHPNLNQSTVFAVLMETAYPEAVATLVAVLDGTVSLYFSNGGGIIGGGEHQPVRKVCAEFITLAHQYVAHSTLTDTFPLPKKDHVRCYLVTSGGVYTFEAPEDDLGYERHPCSPLFHKGHELITAIREHTPE